MPGQPIPLAVDAATFAGMSANDYPDGQRVTVTDQANAEHEARGADGARAWVQIHAGTAATHEVLLDGDSQPVATGDGDWIYVEVTYG